MRIISGQRRGLKLKSPKGDTTRPTESRIKESIFNVLGNNFNNSNVLDLYAGSGSIGLEFLSRGASFCAFVESDANTLKILKENIAKTRFENYKLYPYKSLNALKDISKDPISFDYIYIDPPYKSKYLYDQSLEYIYKSSSILKDSGLLIIEADKDMEINNIDLFELEDSRQYRDTIIRFLRRG